MNKTEMEKKLAELREREEVIKQERSEVYEASLAADEGQKVIPDWLAQDAIEDHGQRFIQYPLTVNGIHHEEERVLRPALHRRGAKWVAVRSVNPKHGNKTYLGVLLGDMAQGVSASLNKDGVLSIGLGWHNPAMYVPDLHEVIFGSGSWWSPIEKPEDLRQITDADIQNVWYVRALKEMEQGTKPAEAISKAIV